MRALALILVCSVVAIGHLVAGAPATSEWLEPHTGMRFVQVPAGRFVMGSPESEPDRDADETPHEVVISRPFHLGTFEVTQEQWKRVMGTTPSRFHGDPARPVENINEFEVQDFLRRMTAMSTDSRFRLPAEAEWEYACRAGTTTAFHGRALLDATHARIDPRRPDDATGPPASGGPARVGSFAPNAWGLHDMHGNVWEWTDDAYCPYTTVAVTDPRPACRGPLRVIRGGSWYFRADSARCATRYTHRPADRGFSLGFRVLRELRSHP